MCTYAQLTPKLLVFMMADCSSVGPHRELRFTMLQNGLSLTLGPFSDLIDLYFKLCGTNMLHKKQIIHKIYNEMTAGGKRGSSFVN